MVPGTEGVGEIFAPAFSPDGRMLAFWSGDGTIKTVPVEGGAILTLCQADNPYGLSWDESGVVFAQGEKATILRVSANGGTPEVIARAKPGEVVSGPELLPGGRFVLFSATADFGVDRWDKARIVARSLESNDERRSSKAVQMRTTCRPGTWYTRWGVCCLPPRSTPRTRGSRDPASRC